MSDFELPIEDMLEIAASGGNGAEYINYPKLLEEAARKMRTLRARVTELEEGLRWIDGQRYVDRATISAETAYQRATKMNALLLEIMDRARALITKGESNDHA